MFYFFAILAMVITVGLLLLVLFEPGLGYRVEPPRHELASEEYLCLLGALSDAQVRRDSRAEVLADGPVFYERELESIRAARRSVNLERYIFRSDGVGRRYVEALAERARAGVKVNVVIDGIGSWSAGDGLFRPLTAAGGRVCRYQPVRWYTLKRLNNRTHRNLLIVDGVVGFIGGAGIGAVWMTGEKGEPMWRDSMVLVTGDLVVGLQSTFAENWLEAADEILTGDEYFPACPQMSEADDRHGPDEAVGMVVNSEPSAGRSTRARVLFQTLLASAKVRLEIVSPYFLPDRSVRRELIDAVKRGVDVKVIVPGDHIDHMLTRRASRRRYGELLRGGVQIYEYQPAMIHLKSLAVDGVWSVVGSTNFDNRSFGINDEVNLAVRCGPFARRLESDFAADLAKCKRITIEEWERRGLWEKTMECAGWIIERHQ